MTLFKCITGLVSENLLAVNVFTESQKLMQYAERKFYPTISSFWGQIEFRKGYFLIRSEILGMRDTTFTANYEYSRINRENLPFPNSAKISQKTVNPLLHVFSIFGIRIKFPMFSNKNEPRRSSISEVIDSERCALFKCIIGFVSENLFAVNVLPSPKNSCNMQNRTFIVLFRPFEPNSV